MKKKQINEKEIDLREIVSEIIKNKYKIFLFSLIPSLIIFFFETSKEPNAEIFKTRTQIKPISIFELNQYQEHNRLINYFKEKNIIANDLSKNLKYNNNFNYNNSPIEPPIDYSSFFSKIDRKFLQYLFLEKISDNKFQINMIKEFGLVNAKNYKSIEDYELQALAISNSLSFSNQKNVKEAQLPLWFIDFQTQNIEVYKDFLKYLEKSVNLEIQNYLESSFNESVLALERFKKYKIEDLELDIEIRSLNKDLNSEYIGTLKRYRDNLKENKSIQRLEQSFASTPISTKKDFYASRLDIKSMKIQKISKEKINRYTSSFLTMFLLMLFWTVIFIFFQKKQKNSR